MTDPNNNQNPNLDGGIDIPVRIAQQIDETDEMIKRLQKEERETADMVRQYEERYSQEPAYIKYADAPAPQAEITDSEAKRKNDSWWRQVSVNVPPSHRYTERPLSPDVISEQERNWAAMAHATSILTLIFLFAGGPAVILPLLVPLSIYLYHRSRSNYVAFHALQAFTMQTVGTIGAMLLLAVGVPVLGILILISAITIIGIPIAIVLAFVLVGLVLGALAMPILMVIYGSIASYAAYRGRNYRYPYVADWVDDQLSNGFLGVKI